jgi:hypothetical protein
MASSEEMGLEEIKRRVDSAIETVLSKRPTDAGWPKVRETARAVAIEIYLRKDGDVVEAVYFQGLLGIVRRMLRLRNRANNRAKQARLARVKKALGKKGAS